MLSHATRTSLADSYLGSHTSAHVDDGIPAARALARSDISLLPSPAHTGQSITCLVMSVI